MPSTSQSVNRTFALYQYFAEEQRALTAQDIADYLHIPKSSCTALLKTLSDLDMLSLDRRTTTYIPTASFAQLGAWLTDESVYPQDLLDAMDHLARVTEETITLSVYNDLQLELVRVQESPQAISFSATPGQKFTVWGSALGIAYLSKQSTQQVRALHKRVTERGFIEPGMPSLEDVLAAVATAKKAGYAVIEAAVYPDAAAIAVHTEFEIHRRPLMLAVAGPTQRLRPNIEAYGSLLCSKVRR